MRAIRWLHISDIHLRERDAWSQDVVLTAMTDDIARQARDGALDFLLLSGDLAFSGRAAEYAMASPFIDALTAASGVPRERMFCIPGNHDIDRERQKLAFIGARTHLQNQNRTDMLLAPDSRPELETLLKRQEGFRSFQSSCFAGQDRELTEDGLAYVSRLTIDGVRLAIIGLDSAWLAEGGIEDHGKLLLGERQVLNALRLARAEADPPHIVVAMCHHPLHLLQEFDRRSCQNALEEGCQFIHCGHLHDPEMRASGHAAAGCLTLAAGASFETRSSANSYSLITLDLLQGTRTVRTIHYNPHDRAFSSVSTRAYPIEVPPSGTCTVGELGHAIAQAGAAARPHYLAALLLDQKSEVPVPAAKGYTLASFAVLESAPDGELKEKTRAFRVFRNALRVLYGREPIDAIFRAHGDAVIAFDWKLAELCNGDAALQARLDAQEADARVLADTEPRDDFSHTAALLSELAEAGEWELLREHALRHLDGGAPVTGPVGRMLALALANSEEPADKAKAIELYGALRGGPAPDATDFGSLALLLFESGDPDAAKPVLLDGIRTFPRAADYLQGVGQKIVEATGDRNFRDQLRTATAKRGERD